MFAPFRAFAELPTELQLMVWKKVLLVELVTDVCQAPEEYAEPCFPSNIPEAVAVVNSNSSNLCEVFRWRPITLDWTQSPANELLEALRYLSSACPSLRALSPIGSTSTIRCVMVDGHSQLLRTDGGAVGTCSFLCF
jgi:hypothetical protein